MIFGAFLLLLVGLLRIKFVVGVCSLAGPW